MSIKASLEADKIMSETNKCCKECFRSVAGSIYGRDYCGDSNCPYHTTTPSWKQSLNEQFFGGIPTEEMETSQVDEAKLQAFISSLLSQTLYNERERMVAIGEGLKKYHKEFECNGAHNGRGCFETFCEDQNCRNAHKEYNEAITTYQQKINSLNS